jgi:probable O-glycosylation ligase (exosortase A-associated)
MILMINLVDTLPKLKITLYTIMFGIGNLVYNGIMVFIHTGSRRIEYIGGQGGGSEFLTYVLTMTLPFLYYAIIGNNKFEKYVSIVVLPFWCFGLFITETRAGLVALFILGLLLFVKSKTKFKLVLIGSIAVVLFVVSAPPTYWERMSTIKQGKDASRVRIDLWTLAFDLFKEHPLLGAGPDNFRDIAFERTPYRAKEARERWGIEVGQEAHNIFLQLLAEGGIISFSIYIIIIISIFKRLYKIRSPANSHYSHSYIINLSHSLELSIIIFFVNCMFLSALHHDVSYWFFAMSESLSNICNKNIDELKEKETSSH